MIEFTTATISHHPEEDEQEIVRALILDSLSLQELTHKVSGKTEKDFTDNELICKMADKILPPDVLKNYKDNHDGRTPSEQEKFLATAPEATQITTAYLLRDQLLVNLITQYVPLSDLKNYRPDWEDIKLSNLMPLEIAECADHFFDSFEKTAYKSFSPNHNLPEDDIPLLTQQEEDDIQLLFRKMPVVLQFMQNSLEQEKQSDQPFSEKIKQSMRRLYHQNKEDYYLFINTLKR